jgi:hypothetical protein
MSLWDTFHNKPTRPNMRKEETCNAKNPYCQLDVVTTTSTMRNGQRRQRQVRQNLGEAIARKRAVTEKPIYDQFKDQTSVVYRRPEDWSHQQSYVNCIFLDQHDTVLCADLLGKIDVIRLPRYEASSSQPRVLGTRMAGELELHPPLSDFSNLKLKTLHGGEAFAVGMPSGKYHVLATEHLSTWGDRYNLQEASFSQQRLQSSSSSSISYIQRGWTLEGPKRRYYRHRENGLLSLSHMIRGEQHVLNHDRHEYSEIDRWNAPTTVSSSSARHRTHNRMRFVPHQRPSNQAKWDFFETPSTLLAAHVDAEHDCFWLKMVDDRTQKTVVCVDTTSRERAPVCEEHITSCAFASEYCLATSHVWSHVGFGSPRASSVFEGGMPAAEHAETHTAVKLWDIRMLVRRGPVEELVLPTFPRDAAVAMEPAVSLNTRVDERDQLFMSSKEDPGKSHHVITNLDSSLKTGTLLVTTCSRSQCRETEHHILDLGRLCFTRRIRQTIPSNGCAPIYGTAASHNYMACLGDRQGEGISSSIQVYNLQETPSSRRSSSKKRTAKGEVKVEKEEDETASFRFRPVLKDRHGLESQLSCLTMNESGTSLLGGSNDGDLFAWRGT